MPNLTLAKYLEVTGKSQSDLSREIGHNRQTINHWVKSGAVVDFTDAGIKITLEKVVHESQVAK